MSEKFVPVYYSDRLSLQSEVCWRHRHRTGCRKSAITPRLAHLLIITLLLLWWCHTCFLLEDSFPTHLACVRMRSENVLLNSVIENCNFSRFQNLSVVNLFKESFYWNLRLKWMLKYKQLRTLVVYDVENPGCQCFILTFQNYYVILQNIYNTCIFLVLLSFWTCTFWFLNYTKFFFISSWY